MPSWRCDCEGVKQSRYGKLSTTKVDAEEKCVSCGYYAIADSDYHLFPKGAAIGGFAPIAKYQTLYKKKGYLWEDVYAIKNIPKWIDLGTGELYNDRGIDRSKA